MSAPSLCSGKMLRAVLWHASMQDKPVTPMGVDQCCTQQGSGPGPGGRHLTCIRGSPSHGPSSHGCAYIGRGRWLSWRERQSRAGAPAVGGRGGGVGRWGGRGSRCGRWTSATAVHMCCVRIWFSNTAALTCAAAAAIPGTAVGYVSGGCSCICRCCMSLFYRMYSRT